MNWKNLSSSSDLANALQRSFEVPVLIFKHSTRCSISIVAKDRLERGWNFAPDQLEPYFLDLLAHRPLSAEIAETLKVYHESPQVILVSKGEAFYDVSHSDIRIDDIASEL